MNVDQEITRLKHKLTEAQNTLAQTEGRLEAYMGQLREAGYATLEEADRAVEELVAQAAQYEAEVIEGLQKLTEKGL